MNWYRNHFIQTYRRKVDDNQDPKQIQAVVDSENQFINGLTPDKLAGGKISYIAGNNPITNILQGWQQFDIAIAFYTPAGWIHGVVGFDPSILESVLGGAS